MYEALYRRDSTGTLTYIPEVFNDLCAYVESGFPVLASLRVPDGGHVVSLIGHTIDYTVPVTPIDGFVDSSQFLKQFVVVDDNFFPYQQLGYETDPENYGSVYGTWPITKTSVGIKDIFTMACPLPEKVFLPAKDAREKAMKHCEKFRSILRLTGAEPFVRRLFVTSSTAFKKRKLAAAKSGGDPASSLVVNLHLPHFLWVMEISPLDLYRAGNCTAEITNPEHQLGETIRIAGAETVFSGFIVPRFDRMREALPQFRFALMQHRTDEATQMVRTPC